MAASCATCISSRSRRRASRNTNTTTTSSSPPSRPGRRHGRSARARARWSRKADAIASQGRRVMFELLGIPPQALFGQLLLGLINGAFYAMLSLGLAVIFGLLNIINFTHGAQYMMGAFCAWFLLNLMGIGYWPSLLIAPLAVGAVGLLR